MKKTRRILAASLALAMAVAAVPVSAVKADPIDWNTQSGDNQIRGEGTVVQPVIEVSLPGDLAFEVDPLMLNSKSQILGGDYNVINRGNVAVSVAVETHITKPETEADFKLDVVNALPDESTVEDHKNEYKTLESEANKDTKKVFLAAVVADKPADGKLVDSNNDNTYEFVYTGGAKLLGRSILTFKDEEIEKDKVTFEFKTDAPVAGTYKILDAAQLKEDTTLTAANTAFTFNLDAAELKDEAYVPVTKGVGSFTIVGAVDPKKTYEDGEIAIHALYKMTLLTAQDEATYEKVDKTADKKVETLVVKKSN